MKILIYSLLLVATIGGMKKCDSDGPGGDVDRTVSLDEVFDLKLNETVVLKKEKIALTFSKSVESRCPVDVNCIRAGEVFATFQLASKTETKEAVIELESNCNPKNEDESCGVTQTAMGYKVRLMSVLPYPGTEDAKAKKPVTARLKVMKIK